ncbi:MAG: hypothetical protein VKK32_04920 [Candidatus Melainabacteria bacterium]|nr:hypothetical protein [Candidatus Melainabacteria bacterium]
MPNYCTVCGVKLTAKNKISYRPSSCRDCELERKRLYSLKRKIQNELEEKASKAAKPASKASVKAVKPTSKVVKPTSKATKEVVLKPKVTKVEESKSTKAKKTPETKNKKIQQPVVIEPKAKTVKLEKKLTAKKKPTNSSTKVVAITKAESLTAKKKIAKGVKDEDIDESGLIEDSDIETVETPVVVKAKSGSAPIVIPSYIKEAAKIKVKKRRLGKLPSVKPKNVSSLNSDSQSEDVSSVFALGKNLTEEDLLRAPSNTPWESSSFKIVDGSFVEHGAEDQDEAKGPSPEEIKNIIEKIRLEHKTRRG